MKNYQRLIIFVLLLTITAHQSIGQVSVNVDGALPDASAMLDVQSTERGFLAPRMTMAQRNAITSPVTGLLIFQTDSTAGFYYFDGASWGIIKTGDNAIDDLIDGKADGSSLFLGTDAGIDDDGTTNENVAIGENSFSNNTSGSNNTAIGFEASRFNTIGWYNTTIGSEANFWNTEGSNNTMIGYEAGHGNTPHSKSGNVCLGHRAGYYETDDNKLYIDNSSTYDPLIYGEFDNDFVSINGDLEITGDLDIVGSIIGIGIDNLSDGKTASGSSVYLGTGAGVGDISGIAYGNVALGTNALSVNSAGNSNTAIGDHSLSSNTGDQNTATGYGSLENNITGFVNTAIGHHSLHNNITGNLNTACGALALSDNVSGLYNTAHGSLALSSITIGSYNTALGHAAFSNGTNYNNSTGLGYNAEPGASNTVRIGDANISTIGGYANWTNVSDKRFKTNVRENVAGLDFIMKLRPVTYNLDMDAIARFYSTPDNLRLPQGEQLKAAELQTGFIAQEVETAANSVGYDFHGVDKPKNENSHYGLRYAEFVVPLVKATQEQQEVIENLEKENTALKEQIDKQNNQMVNILKRINKLENK